VADERLYAAIDAAAEAMPCRRDFFRIARSAAPALARQMSTLGLRHAVDDVTIARALHVLGVIHWIGGLSFVTLVVPPFARSSLTAAEGLTLFEVAERHFAAQVRITVPVVGVCGFWMAYRMDLWSRFAEPDAWWMIAMVAVWALFIVALFVVEPLREEHFTREARRDPAGSLWRLARIHQILLAASVATVFGAVGGAHGLFL
jgi:uncharacterized membrane protein